MRWLAALLAFFALATVAEAQTGSSKTIPQLNTEINANIGSGQAGGITALELRQTLLDMVASTGGKSASVLAYGAVCNGVTDDTAAINAALVANTTVAIPAANCLSTTGITVPAGHGLIGTAFSAGNPPNSNSTGRK